MKNKETSHHSHPLKEQAGALFSPQWMEKSMQSEKLGPGPHDVLKVAEELGKPGLDLMHPPQWGRGQPERRGQGWRGRF